MGTTERKNREKEQRKLDIIFAAEKIFFSKGMVSATVDDVAEAAELSKGTLYLYFKNKDELIAAIFHRGMALLKNMMIDVVKNKASGIEKLQALGLTYLEFSTKYPFHFSLMLEKELHKLEVNQDTPEANACIDEGIQVLKILTETLSEGINQGLIRSDINPAQMALIIWGQIHGVITLASNEEKCSHFQQFCKFSLDSIVTSSIDLIINGIKPQST